MTIRENRNEAVNLVNLFESLEHERFAFGHVIFMLWLDSFVYMVLAWYIDEVYPGAYGIGRSW